METLEVNLIIPATNPQENFSHKSLRQVENPHCYFNSSKIFTGKLSLYYRLLGLCNIFPFVNVTANVNPSPTYASRLDAVYFFNYFSLPSQGCCSIACVLQIVKDLIRVVCCFGKDFFIHSRNETLENFNLLINECFIYFDLMDFLS